MDTKDLIRIGLLILTGIGLVYMINKYNSKNNNTIESFYEDSESLDEEGNQEHQTDHEHQEDFSNPTNYNVQPGEQIGTNEVFGSVSQSNNENSDTYGNQYPTDCFPKDQLTPAELLPGDANSKWAQVNPAGQGELGDQNFLNAGYHVGVNTVGQTLRNANLQLRSEPPNPQVKVSPWLQSTIEPDTNRKPMEIGGCE